MSQILYRKVKFHKIDVWFLFVRKEVVCLISDP